ncbi:hypothetical protein SAMN05414139_10871 [Burkholderia sp. D7]|nr:hypothetical protein SAMN05414139_10871 [Burkholderia sp. D7]
MSVTRNLSAAFDTAFRERIVEWRCKKFGAFDDTALAWLVVAPTWTEQLATTTSFPIGPDETLHDFLARAETAGVCQRDKSGEEVEAVRRSAMAMATLWARLSEPDKRKHAPDLRARAQAMPTSLVQKRIIRETESYMSPEAAPASLLMNVAGALKTIFVRDSVAPDPVTSQRAVEVLGDQILETAKSGNSSLEASTVMLAASHTDAASVVSAALDALSNIQDPKARVRAASTLQAGYSDDARLEKLIVDSASIIALPEDRAQLLLQAAIPASSGQRSAVWKAALAAVSDIIDPESRVAALLNAAPALIPELRAEATTIFENAVLKVDNLGTRAQMLAAALSWLAPTKVGSIIENVVSLAANMTDANQRAGVLASAARALAQSDRIDGARTLAASEDDPVRYALILLETFGTKPAGSVAEATARLNPSQLEELFLSLSSSAGEAVAKSAPALASRVALRAISRGRFALAARVAVMLPERQAADVFSQLLDHVKKVPSVAERLQAVSQIGAYFPASVAASAWAIASSVNVSRGFWVIEFLREDIVEHVQSRQGSTFLSGAAVDSANAVLQRVACGDDVPALTARWAAIAGSKTVAEAALEMTRQIRAAVELGNPSEALEVLNVATPLSRILGAEIEPALIMGRHAIQLTLRRTADERHLARYLPRQEQVEAFKNLLAGTDGHWALHYLGAGGVGKTMLLRHIASKLAVADGRKLPTTRVDFDHISPDFPVRRPGELLANLAEELRFYGGPDQESRYADFVRALNAVHRSLANEPPAEDPLKNVTSSAFDKLLEMFMALFANLPKPVVVMLDTCEELARLEPAGTILPSVEATFLILEKIHERFEDLRVVFAGRRLLARAGDTLADGRPGWEAVPGTLSARNRLLPSDKPYLRLHFVRGLTEQEAVDYFNNVAKVISGDERLAAILRKSPDADLPADICWNRELLVPQEDCPRYNPFDLSLYADWISDVPSLSAETIGSGQTDPYVEMRIVARILDEPVLKMLPTVVLLRRFDVEMLVDLVPDEQEGRRIFRELGGLEWIDYQHDALQVDLNLLPRLLRYYEDESRRHLLDSAREQIGPSLENLVRAKLRAADPFAELTVAHIDAALRLCPEGAASALWDELDRTITESGNWTWADSVCQYVMSEGNAASDPNSQLGAAVRATRAAVALHGSPYECKTAWWAEIQAEAKRHPQSSLQTWLYLRATVALGQIDYRVLARIREFREDDWRYEQLVAGLVAALEQRLELGLQGFAVDMFVQDIAVPLPLRASLAGLSARQVVATRTEVHRAKILASMLVDGPVVQKWADWRAPSSVKHRLWLELLRSGFTYARADELETCRNLAAAALGSVDAERLLSRVLQLQLGFSVPLSPTVALDVIYDPERQPVCNAHREIPPLFVSIAQVRLLCGDARGTRELLSAINARARSAGDHEALAACKRLTLWYKRLMRAHDALSATADLIGIEQPALTSFHRWWATQIALRATESAQLVDEAGRLGTGAVRREDGTLDPHAMLDALELDLIGKRLSRATNHAGPLLAEWDALSAADDPQLSLRLYALRGKTMRDPPPAEERRYAELALEEGELLALRLPEKAAPLFDYALSLYSKAGDRCGESDRFGEFRAAVCAAINAIALDARDAATGYASKAEEAYATWRLRDERLPAWDEIGPQASSRWDAWLLRVARIKAWLAEPTARGVLTEAVEAEIRSRFGTVAQYELTVTTRPQEVVVGVYDGHRRDLMLGIGGGVLGTMLVLAAIATGSQDVFVLLGLALMQFAIVGWSFPIVWSRLTLKLHRPQLLIQEGLDAGDVVLAYRLAGPRQLRPKDRYASVSTLGFQPYATFASGIRKAAKSARLALQPCPTMLIVDRKLASYPWEAPLSIALNTLIWEILSGVPRFVRPGDVLPQPVEGMTQWPTAGVSAFCRKELAPLVGAAWKTVTILSEATWQNSPSRVLHIVGTSTYTPLGPALVLGSAGDRELTPSADLSKIRTDAAIVIVQEEPAARIRRLDVDRERTGDARAWATDLFNSGVQTVIFVPSLPFALVSEVIRTMAERLDGHRPLNLFELLNLVKRAQRRIRRFRVPAPTVGSTDIAAGLRKSELRAALTELSLEVTLFTRSPLLEIANRYRGFTT